MSNGVKTARRFAMAAFSISVLIGSLMFGFVGDTPASAVVGTNEQINFQGRLFNAQGAVVPDGFYNVEFKIYQDGTGQAAGNPGGTLRWTESHLNNNGRGIQVKNGYMSVELGSVNAFGTQVDWNQSVLWLSMNIGSTNATCATFSVCSPDGEMTPMKRLSSSVYAMNANKLGGLTSAGFVQNQNTAAQTATNFWVDGTGRATTLQASTSVISPTLRAVTDSTSGIQLQNATGTTTVMNIDTTNARVGIGTGSAAPTATLQVGGSFNSSGGTISLNENSNFSIAIGSGTSSGPISIGNAANSTTLGSNTISLGSGGAATTLSKTAQTTTNAAGSALTLSGSTGNGTGAGGQFILQGGAGGASGANGGNLVLSGGSGTGSGVNGLVVITTPTFQTASSQSCGANCTISQVNVDSNSAVILNAIAPALTLTLPDPSILTAGRIVYVTAANGSNDFTLSVNGGGTGNQIAMRQNTTATMVWNGSDWTAAGASSSTTLQAAYDNTLTSAGGAELLLSNGANANGLTIRDSSVNPVNGTLLEVQNSSAASLFAVNSNVTEYVTNAGAETAGGSPSTFPASTWSAVGSSTVSRFTTAGNFINTGQASVSAVTTAATGAGVKNQLSTSLNPNMTYNVSFTTRLSAGTFTDMDIYYSVNGTAASVLCRNNQAVRTSVWTKVNCTFTAPASGITASNAILIRQASATARTFYVDNLSVTIAADYNYATDGSVNEGDAIAFNGNWNSAGLGTVAVSRNTTDGNDASDSAQAVISSGATNAGLRNKLSINPLPNTLYRISVFAKLSSGTFNDFKVRYSRDGSTVAGGNYVDCVDYNTQSISTTAWTQVTCYVTTDSTPASNPHVYFVETAAANRTFMVDTFSMTLASNTTPNVQIGGGPNGGPTTLFTLDKGASAPIAADNDALLGSMYYDTTLGKLQCYEADGWGACGSSPDNIVTISPEYTNAVMHGTGVGTMTSDLCSDTLNVNDGSSGQATICGTNETYNFYKWTSPQPTSQGYGIYVTYQLPSTFKAFSSGSTSLMGRTDSANSSVTYQIYRSDAAGLTSCGGSVPVSSGTQATWQVGKASGAADPSACGFAPGNSIVFKINMNASSNANAYVGNLGFTFTNR